MLQLNNLMEIKELEPLLCIRSSNVEIDSLDFLELVDLPEDSQYFQSDNYRSVSIPWTCIWETLNFLLWLYVKREIIKMFDKSLPRSIRDVVCHTNFLFPNNMIVNKLVDITSILIAHTFLWF